MGKLDNHYIKYLEVQTGQKSIKNETPDEFMERVAMSDFRLPYSNYLFLDERCPFLEAVLLRSKRSVLLQTLDDSPETLVFGLEKSGQFVGKASLFCAWVTDSLEDVAWLGKNGFNKQFLGAFCAWKESLVVTCPFSALLGDAGVIQVE